MVQKGRWLFESALSLSRITADTKKKGALEDSNNSFNSTFTETIHRMEISDDSPGPDTDTELEGAARTDHEAESDGEAEVVQTDCRRRRRNSNGGLVGPVTRAQHKRLKELLDHLAPPTSCKPAVTRLADLENILVF